MKPRKSQDLLKHMRPGVVYRREELSSLSKALDRELDELVSKDLIKKPAPGMYYRSRTSPWGEVPADENEMIRAFLKTDDFLLVSTNAYNLLPLGLTQLSNVASVYNRKRIGRFKLGAFTYEFKRPLNFPKKLDTEFLFVDLLNNLNTLPENSDELWLSIKKAFPALHSSGLLRKVNLYGKTNTQKKIKELLEHVA